MNIFFLRSQIDAVCPAVHGVSVGDASNKATWRIDFLPSATPAQRAAAQSVVDTYVEDPAALAAFLRDGIVAEIDNAEDVLRATVLVLVDELNLHSSKIQAMLDAVAAAGTLAAMKTAFAAIQGIPARTPAQLRQAIRNKLGN